MQARLMHRFVAMGHQRKTMVGFVQKPVLLVEEGGIVDHQIVFHVHQQVGPGTVGDQMIAACEGQLPGSVRLQPNHLDPGAEQIQHLIQLMLPVGADADLQLKWGLVGRKVVDPFVMDVEDGQLGLALQPQQAVQAAIQG